MGCSCGKTPEQKLKARIKSWGWNHLTPAYLTIVDEMIFKKFNILPKDMAERIELYNKLGI
jgi:hypothetical protein